MCKHVYAAAFISSILFAFGFFVPYVGEPLALVGFIPLFWYVSQEGWSYKKSFLSFFLSGVLFFGATLAWMFALMPLEWAGIESVWTAYGLFLPVWLLIIVSFAFWWGVFGLGARYFLIEIERYHSVVSAVFLGVLWVVTEYARSFMIGFLGFSPTHSSLFSEWTLGSLVYAMTDGWMVLLASIGGLHLVNFVIMICNVWIFLQWRRASTPRKGVLCGVAILVGVIGISAFFGVFVSMWHEHAYRSARSYEIGAMRTDIPRVFLYSQDIRVIPLRESIDAVISLPQKIDVLVAPESANVLSFDALNGMRLIDRMKKDGTTLVDHIYAQQAGGLESRTFYWRPDRGIIGFQGKRILMPIGEYLPSVVKMALGFFGYQYTIDTYEETRALISSEKGSPITDARGTYGSVVCSEVLNPNSIRSLTKAGAEVIFLQSSDALFRGNFLYAQYMIAMAQVRAIESGRFVVRASNAGPTAIIDSLGRVRVKKDNGNGVIYYNVPLLHISTPYVRWGARPIP